MKKSNWLIFAILLIGSVGFLLLWYFLGFHHVHMLDLILSVIWWVIIAAAVIVIIVLERKRQKVMRTAFMGENALFNPEAGVVNYASYGGAASALEHVLADMDYNDMQAKKMPDMNFRLIVNTDKYSKDDSGASAWTGEVTRANEDRSGGRPFRSRNELEALLQQNGI